MALIVQSDEMPLRSGPGWTEAAVADEHLSGVPVLTASRLIVDREQRTPEFAHEVGEQMVYVVSGSGKAFVNGGVGIPLERETMLWLEIGDRCIFEAGLGELVLLRASAPPLAGGS
jgi:quercetin dioxygenase-like cupin family protein